MPVSVRHKIATIRRLGLRGVLRRLASGVGAAIWTHERLVVFQVRPGELNRVAPELGSQSWRLRSESTARFPSVAGAAIPAALASELGIAVEGQRVHWIEVAGEIVSWGFSAPARGPWPLTETRTRLHVPAGGVCLLAFQTIPAFRGRRLYPAVLTGILEERFHEGVPVAYIWCRQENRASYQAIRRVGFREVALHDYRRLLGVAWRRERSLA